MTGPVDGRHVALAARLRAVRDELGRLDVAVAGLGPDEGVVMGRRVVAMRAEVDQLEAELAARAVGQLLEPDLELDELELVEQPPTGPRVVPRPQMASPGSHMTTVRVHLERRSTLRLRAFETRTRRRARRGRLNVYGLAELAAVRSVLQARGVELPDVTAHPPRRRLSPATVELLASAAVALVVLAAALLLAAVSARNGGWSL